MSAFGNAGRIFYEDVKAGRSTQIEHINKARQAAEALFAPKQQIGPTPACVPPDSTDARKPPFHVPGIQTQPAANSGSKGHPLFWDALAEPELNNGFQPDRY